MKTEILKSNERHPQRQYLVFETCQELIEQVSLECLLQIVNRSLRRIAMNQRASHRGQIEKHEIQEALLLELQSRGIDKEEEKDGE